jgi:hypothetical protein
VVCMCVGGGVGGLRGKGVCVCVGRDGCGWLHRGVCVCGGGVLCGVLYAHTHITYVCIHVRRGDVIRLRVSEPAEQSTVHTPPNTHTHTSPFLLLYRPLYIYTHLCKRGRFKPRSLLPLLPHAQEREIALEEVAGEGEEAGEKIGAVPLVVAPPVLCVCVCVCVRVCVRV